MKSRHGNAVAPGRATALRTSRNNAHGNNTTRAKPFEIWTARFDGRERFYQGYADLATAELVANRLREIGLACEIRVRA